MQDILRHQRFTRELGRFSDRLDDLMLELRRHEPSHMPPELLDEMASTLGELMLVLIEHKDADGANPVSWTPEGDVRVWLRRRSAILAPLGDRVSRVTMVTPPAPRPAPPKVCDGRAAR